MIFEDPGQVRLRLEAIAKAQSLGLKVKVVTGDYLETTIAVLNKLRIQDSRLKIQEIEVFALRCRRRGN